MKTEPDLTITQFEDQFRVVETQTGLIWRTLPTRSSAEAWMAQCVKEVPCEQGQA